MQIMTVEASRVAAADSKLASPVPDLTRLSYLNEPSILHNLQLRFSQGKIYTAAGPVLIAINPFTSVRLLGLPISSLLQPCLESISQSNQSHASRHPYTMAVVFQRSDNLLDPVLMQIPADLGELIGHYKDRKPNLGTGSTEPHVFLTTSQAFFAMCRSRRHQSLVISGESGSGKTETTKIAMQVALTPILINPRSA